MVDCTSDVTKHYRDLIRAIKEEQNRIISYFRELYWLQPLHVGDNKAKERLHGVARERARSTVENKFRTRKWKRRN